MKFGVDIDDTIQDTHLAVIDVFNQELSRTISIEEMDDFYLDRLYDLTPDEEKRLWEKLQEKIYRLGVPRSYAAEVLTRWDQEGHEIYFITARPNEEKIRLITEKWLQKHGFPFHGTNLIMGAYNKAEHALALGIDLFFEDAPQHLDTLVKHQIPTIIMDQVYNRKYPHALPRMDNWREIDDYVQTHLGQSQQK